MPNNMMEEVKIVLLKNINLDKTYKNTLTFTNQAEQAQFFYTKKTYEALNCTYQQIDGYIDADLNAESVWGNNYVMFQNYPYSDKWYYAFIERSEYLAENTTRIYIELDVMQTWQFDYQLLPSFVEREHANTDKIGDNLIPERLETGEYTYNSMEYCNELTTQAIIVASTVNENGDNIVGALYGGVFSGCGLYAWHLSAWRSLASWLHSVDELGKGGSIVSIFMYPEYLLPDFTDGSRVPITSSFYREWKLSGIPNNIDGYIPKNNKLFTYPFNYLVVSDLSGNANTLHYEYFNDEIILEINGTISATPDVICIPRYYKNIPRNFGESIHFGRLPVCSWGYDNYANWAAQNNTSTTISMMSSLLGLTVGAATGNVPVAIGSALSMGQTLANVYNHSIIPPTLKGSASNSLLTALGIQTFFSFNRCITAEFARIIDDYFSLCGYQTNRVKVPNIYGRRSWNFVKTNNCNLTANFNSTYISKIKSIFDNGITFWHGDYIGDYSRNNEII